MTLKEDLVSTPERPVITGQTVFAWSHDGRPFVVPIEQFGTGAVVLFLPAPSTVSTREEWRTVAMALADQFTVVLIDWPGFGGASRPAVAYTAHLYQAFLQDFVRQHLSRTSAAVVAAGHAAGYVLRLAAAGDATWSRAVLAAPTWRGPLPTVMGEHARLYRTLRAVVRTPGIGHALYRLNTSRRFLGFMLGRHVFSDPVKLTPELLAKKQSSARQRGARFAAAAFVSGALDPFADRESWVEALRVVRFPVQLVIGDRTPPKSRVEMAALAEACPRPPLVVRGALGLHEECAHALVGPLRAFLAGVN